MPIGNEPRVAHRSRYHRCRREKPPYYQRYGNARCLQEGDVTFALRFALAVLAPQCARVLPEAIRVWTRLRDAFRFRLRRRVVSSVCVAFRAHWRHSGSLVVISAE
jgi:hypothetical protein